MLYLTVNCYIYSERPAIVSQLWNSSESEGKEWGLASAITATSQQHKYCKCWNWFWINLDFKLANNNAIEVKMQAQLKYTFQQRSLAWPIRRKARPRHPVSPPVQRNKKKDKCQHFMTFDSLVPTSRAIFFFLTCVSRVVFKQWHLKCSLQSAVTSRGPYVLRTAPLCPQLFMHR